MKNDLEVIIIGAGFPGLMITIPFNVTVAACKNSTDTNRAKKDLNFLKKINTQ